MSLLDEIHNQSHTVRKALWMLSTFIAVSFVGFFWFTSLERSMFLAFDREPQEEAQFLARQDERSPKPLAFIGRGLGSLTAAIGGALGLDRSAGFDRPAQSDKTYMLPLSN